MMIDIAVSILLYIAFMGFAGKRLLTYMHILQQEEYDNGRFFIWMLKNKGFDKRLSFVLLIMGGAAFILPPFIAHIIVFLAMAFIAFRERDPRKGAKKKLASTARVKRIFIPAYIVSILLGLWCFYNWHELPIWIWIANVQALPFILIASNIMLRPVEDHIQKTFWNEAHAKIMELSPTIIGITGSFGKTSVKHILGHILRTHARTLVTPGSVNTPMGITRIIREDLDESHKYFIVEMGAYGPGSIARLCKLAPPDYGIITALGHAHYERFKSLETVAETKFELAEAVLEKENGHMTIHERTLRFNYSWNIKNKNPERFTVCGQYPDTDLKNKGKKGLPQEQSFMSSGDIEIKSIKQDREGLEVAVHWKKDICYLHLPLFGVHHAHNAVLAFAAAIDLGVPVDHVITALKSVPQISHRLEVKERADGITFIDDAFNSNPLGFRAAIELLSVLGKEGRKILITPGMVELGATHDEAHKSLGQYAGQICDFILVVNPKRIPSFIEGAKSTAGEGQTLIEFSTFQEAALWVEDNKREHDVVLIENDLPDIYESLPKF